VVAITGCTTAGDDLDQLQFLSVQVIASGNGWFKLIGEIVVSTATGNGWQES
jgi:hypothetical protein